jgi:hypothetical protein
MKRRMMKVSLAVAVDFAGLRCVRWEENRVRTHRKQRRGWTALGSHIRRVLLVRCASTVAFLTVALSAGFVSASNAVGSVEPACVGDCDNSGAVTVDELVKGVSIALGTLPLDQCP